MNYLLHPDLLTNNSENDAKEVYEDIHLINIEEEESQEYLSEILKEKKIVFLGEQLHSDGTTFQIKGELIKFMHEKLGYDVVLYEAGMYDMWMMNNEMDKFQYATPSEIEFDGIYDFWYRNSFCEPIWQYYLDTKKSNNPISLGGFDVQISSPISSEQRYSILVDYLQTKSVFIEDFPTLQRYKDKLNWLNESFYHKGVPQTTKDSLIIEFTSIIDKLKLQHQGLSDDIYIRYLHNLKDRYSSLWKYETRTMESMHIRDSLMAENLTWLIDSIYTDQKIIVWTANVHSFKRPLDKYQFKPLGEYIERKYREKFYSMAFSSYAQENIYGGLKDKANVNTLEYSLHQAKKGNLYINTEDIPPESILRNNFMSVMNQRENMKESWTQLVDGIYYIDVITPIN